MNVTFVLAPLKNHRLIFSNQAWRRYILCYIQYVDMFWWRDCHFFFRLSLSYFHHHILPFLSFTYLALSQKQDHCNSICQLLHVDPYYLTHCVNFLCGTKPEYPEEAHDFQQSVDLYSFHMRTGFESTLRNGSCSTTSEALSQLDNHFIKERRILIVDWSNVVQTSHSEHISVRNPNWQSNPRSQRREAGGLTTSLIVIVIVLNIVILSVKLLLSYRWCKKKLNKFEIALNFVKRFKVRSFLLIQTV